MRKADNEILKKVYEPLPADFQEDLRFEQALEVYSKNFETLKKLILDDFDEGGFGIGWWSNYKELGTKRRIYISDYLYQVCSAIGKNLIDAKIHLMSLRHSIDLQNASLVDSYAFDNGKLKFTHPQRNCAQDELNTHLVDIHIAGFLRAIGSSLDCLGGTIVGVLGLPTSILKADLYKAQLEFGKIKNAKTPSEILQAEYGNFLIDSIGRTGPTNWNVWTNQYRNMIVHRARRMSHHLLKPKPVGIYVFTKVQRKLKTRSETYLSRYPDFTDLEAIFHNKEELVLNEDVEITLTGIFESTKYLIDENVLELMSIWHKRKADPNLISQPRKQWADVREVPEEKFGGYAPKEPISFSQMTTHPKFVKRIKCASLDIDNFKNWTSFD